MLEIRNIIRFYDKIDHSTTQVALASVVSVEESSYRRIGARMLVRSDGLWVGGISGGCLEGHALKKAQAAILNNEPSLVAYDTMDDDANEIGVGLGCNGRILVLFSPIDITDESNEIEQLRIAVNENQQTILIKVIKSTTAPQIIGLRKLLLANSALDSLIDLSISDLTTAIKSVRKKKKSKVVHVYSEIHGDLDILIEYIPPEIRLIIVGDNYDIHALIDVATSMGWEIVVIGKAKKLSKSVFQKANRVLDPNQVDLIDFHSHTAVILMAHDYKRDKQMLKHFVQNQPAYLGILGPKKRFEKMKYELDQFNFNSMDFIHSPTGLEIGAESPQEIALSIAAEIIASFRNKTGGMLREKVGAIHERKEA